MLFGKIILSLKNSEVDRIFDYIIPENMKEDVQVGLRVIVPFGIKNVRTEGYIIDISDQSEISFQKMKTILQILDNGTPIFSQEMIALAKWMKEKYYCTLSQCLQTIMPSGIKTKSFWTVHINSPIKNRVRTKMEQNILDLLCTKGGYLSQHEIKKRFGAEGEVSLQNLKVQGDILFKQKTTEQNLSRKVRYVVLNKEYPDFEQLRNKIEKNKRLEGQRKVLNFLWNGNEISVSNLKEELQITESPIKTLSEKGAINIYTKEVKRTIYDASNFQKKQAFIPTLEQENVLQQLKEELTKQQKKVALLHGVTGSGKTEIYLQMIAEILKQDKQAIVLVPEISLTPMMVERFVSRFGNKVSITHSRLSYGERLDQWKKAKENEISVMIGARSALFTPFSRLGIVIIDEEHENSYRSDTTPKYDTKEVAEKLCELTNSLLILGSATPDIPMYYRAMQGEVLLLEMKHRTKGSHLPEMIITDMRKELEDGNRSMFSRELYDAMKETLRKKQQIILFLNRRGYSTFVSCRKCGHVMTCPDCSVSYTYHAYKNELVCHYCGNKTTNPTTCPSCGSKYIRYFGTGTQKVEEETKKLFPEATILRMDLDTTKQKHSHQKILEQFGKGYADILIGTQMIAKGHDFPNVTLVGIMAADLSLYMSSYHAAEINYQLITQAAGRAGRDEYEGKVFIQTYHPEHYSIVLAAQQNYKQFYEQECKYRQFMEYPPFSHLFAILLSGTDEKQVMDSTFELVDMMKKRINHTTIELLGPSPATISKIKKEYRWRIILKGKDEQELKKFVLSCVQLFQDKRRRVYLNLIYNPLGIV